MTLADVQQEIAESHEYEHVLHWAKAVTQLLSTLQQLTMLRNRPLPDMAPEQLAMRRSLLDITIKISKAEFKTASREFADALTKWEGYP